MIFFLFVFFESVTNSKWMSLGFGILSRHIFRSVVAVLRGATDLTGAAKTEVYRALDI